MKIYVLNTLSIGEDSIELLSRGIDIIGVIGLSNREPGDAISDFAYQKVFCDKQKLKFIEIDASKSLDEVTESIRQSISN